MCFDLQTSFNDITPDRRQSKMLLTIDECGSKIARNSVFDRHMSRQMAIKNSFSSFYLSTFLNNINDFDCHLSGFLIDICREKWQSKTPFLAFIYYLHSSIVLTILIATYPVWINSCRL